jgi:VanZ family protein
VSFWGCNSASSERPLRRILLLVIILIVYGSLYPWHFVPHHLAENPFRILLHSWPREAPHYFFEDAVVNIALYTPLGFAAYLAFRKSLLAPVLLGLLLSSAIEITQLFTPTRITSMMDVISNVAGSALGVAVAIAFSGVIRRWHPHSHVLLRDRGALALILCWAASLLLPFFPVLGLYLPDRKLMLFLDSPAFTLLPFVSAAAVWFVLGLLIEATGVRFPRGLTVLTVLAIPAQILVASRQPVLSQLAGAIVGVLIFSLRPRARRVSLAEACAFAGVVIFRGLWPFRFVSAAAPFGWIPFTGALTAAWLPALLVLSEKVFYYGAAVWLLHAAGIRLARSAAAVAIVLGAIEIVQTHLPGRTPEITDPLMAILIGFVLGALNSAEHHRDLQPDFQTSSSSG